MSKVKRGASIKYEDGIGSVSGSMSLSDSIKIKKAVRERGMTVGGYIMLCHNALVAQEEQYK